MIMIRLTLYLVICIGLGARLAESPEVGAIAGFVVAGAIHAFDLWLTQ